MRVSKGLLIRIAVAVVLLASIFLLQADLSETLRLVRQADWRYLTAAIAVAILGEIMTAYKLKRLFNGVGRTPGMGLVTRSCFIAMFYNNVLPGSVGGDFARVFLLAREAGGKAMAAAGVFMQRNTGLAGLLSVALVASLIPPYRLQLFSGPLKWLDFAFLWFAGISLAYLAINAVLVSDRLYHIVWVWLAPRIASREGSVQAAGFAARMKSSAGYVAGKLQRLHESVRLFQGGWALALVISIATQLVDCVLVMLAAWSLGLDLSFRFLCICVPAVSLAALMPVSVNGIGLREWVYTFFLAQVAVKKEYAVALSLLHFSAFIFMSIIGGILQWTGAARPVPLDQKPFPVRE